VLVAVGKGVEVGAEVGAGMGVEVEKPPSFSLSLSSPCEDPPSLPLCKPCGRGCPPEALPLLALDRTDTRRDDPLGDTRHKNQLPP